MRPRAHLLIVMAALAAPLGLGAQTIEGRVIEYGTETPLEGAHVFLLDDGDRRISSTFSDSAGAFRLAPPTAGAWRLGAELLGHGTVRSEPLEIEEEETVEVEIRLTVEPVEIEDPIVVVAPRPRIAADIEAFWTRVQRGEKSGFGTFLYGQELDRASPYASDVLRMVPGVRVSPGRRGQVVRMRGGCLPAIYLDGAQLNRFQASESMDHYVVLDEIEGIEVYRGAQQPGGMYHDRTGCGLVLIWTKRGMPNDSEGFGWKRLAIGAALILGLLLIR